MWLSHSRKRSLLRMEPGRPQYKGANRPSSDGKRDDGKSAPFIQFTWRRCGVRGQQLGNKRLALRSLKMCVCARTWRNTPRRPLQTYISQIINSGRQCVDDPTARLPLIPHLDPAFCHLVSWETSLTPVLTSSPADPEGLTRISCCPRQGGRGCERFPGGGRFTTR